MHPASFLTITVAILSTASAFVIPANQADGIYHVRRDASGNDIHTSIAVPQVRREAAVRSRSSLKKRDIGHTYCGCGIELNHGDTDAAVADLKTQLGDKGTIIKPDQSFYSIRGGVVAFVCNNDGNAPMKAWADVVTQAAGQITTGCGQYIAGSTGGPFAFAFGYMKNSEGLDFCGQALTSPSDHC